MNISCVAVAQAANLGPSKKEGAEIRYACPNHADNDPSLSINPSKDCWMCGPCRKSGNYWALAAFLSGQNPDDKPAITAWLRERGLLSGNGDGPRPATATVERRMVASYPYHDADGRLIYEVVRFAPKDFRQRRPDDNGGHVWDLKGVKRVPYRLPELLKTEYVHIPEGEKDCHALEEIGLFATCNPGGAGKWPPNFAEHFNKNQRVAILPDNDTAGRDHAELVARSLVGSVGSLKIVELHGLPDKGDISDWLHGRDPIEAAEELARIIDGTPEYVSPVEERYRIHWAREALLPQPPLEYIIKPLFSKAGVSLIVGESGTKKTWSMIDACICIALGKDWLGLRTFRTTSLIVDEENGARRVARRLGDGMRGHGAGDDLRLAYISLAGFNLINPEDVDRLRGIILDIGAGFVMIDALADVMLGGDENLVKDTQPVFYNARAIAEKTQAHLAIVHHANRAGGYRGSSALKAGVDLMLKVDSKPESSLIEFTCEKSRDSIVPPFSASAHFDFGTFRLSGADVSEKTPNPPKPPSASEAYVLRYLNEHPDATIQEVMDHADVCTGETARRCLYRLAEDRLITRTNAGGKGSEARYKVVQSRPSCASALCTTPELEL